MSSPSGTVSTKESRRLAAENSFQVIRSEYEYMDLKIFFSCFQALTGGSTCPMVSLTGTRCRSTSMERFPESKSLVSSFNLHIFRQFYVRTLHEQCC
jgi:hypothetical protein